MKTSIVLSAVNRFTQPIDTSVASVGKLKNAIGETSGALTHLQKKQKLVANYQQLDNRLEDTRSQLSKAKVEVDKVKTAESSAAVIVKGHTKALKTAEKAVLDAAHSFGVESAQVKKAQQEVVRLTKEKKQAEKVHKRAISHLKSTEVVTERLNKEYGRQSQKLAELKRELAGAGVKTSALGAEQLRLAKQTNNASQSLARQEKQLKRIQSIEGRIAQRNAQKGELAGRAVETAAMAAPLVMAGKRAVEYESTFADVKKVVSFSSEQQAIEYKRSMMQLAGELGIKQEGIAEIVTAAGQSGIEKTQLLQFAESATKMSVAWDVSADEAGETLATWRAAMGLSQEHALDLADATNYLSNNMNAQAKTIASVMVRQGSTAMGAGFNYQQTAALSASLIAGGASEEVAATALKNITGRLTTGYAATGNQQKAMSKIGFDAEELAMMMQDDAQSTLLEVMRQLQQVDAAERGAVISQIFGEEVKGAVSKLVTTLDDDKNGLVSAFKKVTNVADRAGSVNDEYANRAATRGYALAKLSAKFDRMMITLGDRLLPVLDAVLPPLMTVIDGISNFAEANPQLATSLMAVAGTLVVLKAGALAFSVARLALGNGVDRLRLGRERLSLTTNKAALSTRRATSELTRFNMAMDGVRTGTGLGDFPGRKKSGRGRFKQRPGAGGRFGAMAANVSASALSAPSLAGAGKVVKPLGLLLSAGMVAQAAASGDTQAVATNTGEALGGLGGAASGATTGAAIGTLVLPGVGTAVGGLLGSLVGGFGGGELGRSIGESVGSWLSSEEGSPKQDAESAPKKQPDMTSESSSVATRSLSEASILSAELSKHQLKLAGQSQVQNALSTSATELHKQRESTFDSSRVLASRSLLENSVSSTEVDKLRLNMVGQRLADSVSVTESREQVSNHQAETTSVNSLTSAVRTISEVSARSTESDTLRLKAARGNAVTDTQPDRAGFQMPMAGSYIQSSAPLLSLAVGQIGSYIANKVHNWLAPESGSTTLSSQIEHWLSTDKTTHTGSVDSRSSLMAQNKNARVVHYAPVIHIQSSGDPVYDKKVGQELMNTMESQIMPLLMGVNEVAVLADASLTDRDDT
ncbi:phage tail tape measure protein [Pseudoalteromonas rubra]|uniref:phage tail tape measure protein n=1 Tax=Pseudoalteromonas rubra TaxID=43658 RepID=UPI000F797FC6|nr:phage tail tape measure protein [Pseudoalteromonas rubra]